MEGEELWGEVSVGVVEDTLLRGFLGEPEWPVMAEDRDRVVITGSEPRRSATMRFNQ